MAAEPHSPDPGAAVAAPHPPVSVLRLPKSLLWIGGVVVAWFAISEVATEAWYRWKESQAPMTAPWMINWPTDEDAAARGFRHFETRQMTDREQELLRYETAKTASWRDRHGYIWTGFLLGWQEDKRLNQNDITHNPTVCFPAAGLKLSKALPDVAVSVGKENYNFKAWQFEMNDQTIFVYMAIRWVRDLEQVVYREGQLYKRIASLWKPVVGNRGNPLQTLQLVVMGPRSNSEANHLLSEQLRQLVEE